MIIDTSNTIPTREMLFADLFTPQPGMEGYIKLFGAKWAAWLGMTTDEFNKVTDSLAGDELREELIKRGETGPIGMDNFVKILKENGITWSALHNMDESNTSGSAVPNQYVADIIKKYPNQFIAFTGYNPHKSAESLANVEHALNNLGFKAVVFRPFAHGCYANEWRGLNVGLVQLIKDEGVEAFLNLVSARFGEVADFQLYQAKEPQEVIAMLHASSVG